MNWAKCSMLEAMNWARDRDATADEPGTLPDYAACGVIFTDGSALACKSEWVGPYSEVTPDIDAQPPVFWIGTKGA